MDTCVYLFLFFFCFLQVRNVMQAVVCLSWIGVARKDDTFSDFYLQTE